MPFEMVSGVGRGMAVLDGGNDRRRERGQFGVSLGLRDFAALPKLLYAGLVL